MVRIPLAVAIVFGALWSAAIAQDTSEKGGAGLPGKSTAPPGAAKASPGPSGAASSVAMPAVVRPDRAQTERMLRPFAERLLKQWDTNNNGVLQEEEWSRMAARYRAADLNGDGKITLDELVAFLASRSGPSGYTGPMPPDFSPPSRPSAPPPESRELGGPSSSASRILETLGMSEKPLDPRAATVEMRLLVAESVADAGPGPLPSAAPAAGGGKPRSVSSKTPSAKPSASPSDKREGLVEIDLAASKEKIQEDLAKTGIRGRWEFFQRVQLAAADGQVAFVYIGRSEPQISGVAMSQFGRTNSVLFQNVGFIVGVQPHVGPGGVFTVHVDVSSSRGGSDDEGIPLSRFSGETISSRPIHSIVSRSTVRVPSGKTVVVARMSTAAGGRNRELVILLSAQVAKTN